MNRNENTRSNSQDCEELPELVDLDIDIELQNSVQQHTGTLRQCNFCEISVSGGRSEESHVYVGLDNSDETALLVHAQWILDNMEQLRDLLSGTHRIRALTDNCPEQFRENKTCRFQEL